jgi:hypothetical protein
LFGIDVLNKNGKLVLVVPITLLMEGGYCRGKFAKMIPSTERGADGRPTHLARHPSVQ